MSFERQKLNRVIHPRKISEDEGGGGSIETPAINREELEALALPKKNQEDTQMPVASHYPHLRVDNPPLSELEFKLGKRIKESPEQKREKLISFGGQFLGETADETSPEVIARVGKMMMGFNEILWQKDQLLIIENGSRKVDLDLLKKKLSTDLNLSQILDQIIFVDGRVEYLHGALDSIDLGTTDFISLTVRQEIAALVKEFLEDLLGSKTEEVKKIITEALVIPVRGHEDQEITEEKEQDNFSTLFREKLQEAKESQNNIGLIVVTVDHPRIYENKDQRNILKQLNNIFRQNQVALSLVKEASADLTIRIEGDKLVLIFDDENIDEQQMRDIMRNLIDQVSEYDFKVTKKEGEREVIHPLRKGQVTISCGGGVLDRQQIIAMSLVGENKIIDFDAQKIVTDLEGCVEQADQRQSLVLQKLKLAA